MIKIFTGIYILIFFSFSCKGKITSMTESIKDTFMQKKILEKQLYQGAHSYNQEAGVEIPKQPFSQEELTTIAEASNEVLVLNGYRNIGNEAFQQKIKEIFGRLIDSNSSKKYLYINYKDKCSRDFSYKPPASLDVAGIYIAKGDNFLFDFKYLPEVIDYKKKYPDLSNVEDTMSINRVQEGERIIIEKWSSMEENKDPSFNLVTNREKIRHTIISRNKYLFNNSKADFIWLRANDSLFLNNLVKIFGYVKDNLLTRFVLDQNLSKMEELGKVLWCLTCDRKMQFHNEVVALINQSTVEEQRKYLDAIFAYISFFVERSETDYSIGFSQKAEVLGKLAYHAEELAFKISYRPFRFFVLLNKTSEYQKQFEAEHYYNIAHFKEIWEEAKTGGINLPM